MPLDQPRPEAKPTREHEEAAIQWASSVMTGTPTLRIYEIQRLAALLASRDAEAEGRGRRLEREAVIRFLNAQPTGVSLPSCAQAIGGEVHLATPAAPGAPALERQLCGLCGGDGFHAQGPGVYRDCERCSGTGKEPT